MTKRALTDEEKALLKTAMQDVQPLSKKERTNLRTKTVSITSARPATDHRPSTILDLHGLTLEKAHARLVAFIEAHTALGSRDLLVITGKSGALAREVPRWLTLSDMKTHVNMVSKASPRQGGEGALCVRLRKRT